MKVTDYGITVNIKNTYPYNSPSCTVMSGCFTGIEIPKEEYQGQKIDFVISNDMYAEYNFNSFVFDVNNYPFMDNMDEKPHVFTEYSDFNEYIDRFVVRVYVPDDEYGFIDNWFSPGEELLDKYNEEYFRNNVLFIQYLYFAEEKEVSVKSVCQSPNSVTICTENKDSSDGNAVSGCFVGYEVSADEYKGQTFRVAEDYSEKYNAFVTNPEIHPLESENAYSTKVFSEYSDFTDYLESFEYSVSGSEGEYLSKYDEKFFEENVLFIKYIGFSNTGYDLSVNSLTKYENGNFRLLLDNCYMCGTVNSDFTGCFAGFEMPKSEYGNEVFSADIHNLSNDTYTNGIVTEPE